MQLPDKEKAEGCANNLRPNDSTPDQEAQIADSMTDATQSVKRGARLDEAERKVIADTLAETRGNMSEAARLLGIDRRTLYRKLDARPVLVAVEEAPAAEPRRAEPRRAEPWLTLGYLRDDLKIVRALLVDGDPGNVELALRRTLRALHRIGDGELSAERWPL
jgi:DNA-binding phage protein